MRPQRRDAVHCLPSPLGLAALLRYTARDIPQLVRAFERTVDPLLDQGIGDPVFRQEARQRLLGTGFKVGLAMWSYAGAAHVRFDPEMAVLGGAFTRLYDDLMEDREHTRFDALFHGRGFVPGSELEALLASLYRTIDEKLGRSRDDPLFEIARRVHAWQIASTRQRSPEISDADVREITLGKGGWGVAALCALLRPAMSSADRDAAVRLGGLLQVFDDHYDRELDAADGIATTATRRLYTISDLASEAGAVRRELRAHFGPGRERRSSAMIFAMLAIVPILRMREAVGGGSRRHQILNSSNSRRHFLRRTSPLDVRDR